MKFPAFTLALLAALALTATAHAQSHGSIRLTATAMQAKTVTTANGTSKTTMVPAARVLPGTKVTYTITYHNIGKKPAGNVVVNDPVPAHMHYVAGSAQGTNTSISYSVDGGKTWADALAKLHVNNPDGSTRTADAGDCTNIRWVVNNKVAPGARGSVHFQAVLQ
jgi:uncharacterized repeat protein (TIGR01451 family)